MATCPTRVAIACAMLAGPIAAQPSSPSLEDRIRAAEDARAESADALSPILAGLRGGPDAQQLAVRSLGRLQRETLIASIVPLLAASGASVRAEAVNALAQAVVGGRASPAFATLVARTSVETDPHVLGAIARALGRLPYSSGAEVAAAEAAMLRIAASADGAASSSAVADVAHGFDALARRAGRLPPAGSMTFGPATQRWLRARVQTMRPEPGNREASDPVVRRLALSSLVTLKAVDEPLARSAGDDPDDQMRRLAVLGAAAAAPAPWTMSVFERADADPAVVVRVTALRARMQRAPDTACAAAQQALADASPHVSLLAIDIAGEHCTAQPGLVNRLDALRGATWHTRAHVLVALARLDPERARQQLHGQLSLSGPGPAWPFGRYAARAAGILRDTVTLRRLTNHPHPNVVEAALTALETVAADEGDELAIAALSRDDHQLLLTAARALAGTPRREAAARALVAALARVTARGHETSRDARVALLDRLEELGRESADAGAVLRARLADFDPVVAGRAAAILQAWSGDSVVPAPRPLPRAPLPSAARLARFRESEVVMTLSRGGEVRIRLFPDEAPTNVARFVRLIEQRYFDGLSFHRVEPGFVIQGGSPNGNEYVGDGPFTRDEFGTRSHRRGTIGISTRGRDTGDGQIFVNLVDNPRLDHAYTIIGEVIDGMDTIDGVLEADAVATVRLVER